MRLVAIGLLVGIVGMSISNGRISSIPRIAQDKTESLLALEDSEILFADRMRIELKKGSKIIYPTTGNGIDFNITLLGTAQFEIMRGYRVVVDYNEILVKATAANFLIEKGRGTIEVFVTNNQVSIITSQQNIVIYAFQRATYNVLTKQVIIADTRVKRT